MAPVVTLQVERRCPLFSKQIRDKPPPTHAHNVCVLWQTCMYLHNQLVGSGHECEAVGVVECLRDVLAEGVAGASGRDTPTTTVIRV